MNFDAFIVDCRSQWPSFDNSQELARLNHPHDRRLAGLLTNIKGKTLENVLMLLNLAVSHLGDDEIYVEIGSLFGRSLTGAAYDNPQAKIYACDNFSQFDGREDILEATLKKYTLPGQVNFSNMDFREFLLHKPWGNARVGVYFYDGSHTFEDQFAALNYMLPWLAGDALIFIDDVNLSGVRSANRLFSKLISPFELVASIRTPLRFSAGWADGVEIFRYRSNDHARSLTLNKPSYQVRRMFWNGMALLRILAGKISVCRSIYRKIRRIDS